MALHKRIILHPISVFLLLCVGVFMAGMTAFSFAESYTVHAKVSAPLPTLPGSITSPTDQTHVTGPAMTISGDCPADTYIKLYQQDVFSGMAVCGSSDSTYHIDVQLQPGANSFYARIFNLTDDEGPLSDTITVWYDVPVQPQQASPVTKSPARTVSALPLLIKVEDYHYKVHESGQLIRWAVRIEGGTAPYALTVDWGDGTTTTTSQATSDTFEISQSYNPSTAGDTVYTIKLEATDAGATKSWLQLATVVHVPGSGTGAGAAISSSGGGGSLPTWLQIAWPSYGIVALMAISFWLGERQEVFAMLQHTARPRPRRHG